MYFQEDRKKIISVSDLKEFFDSVKNNQSIIDKAHIEEVLLNYKSVLDNAVSNGQTALIEKIKDLAEVLRYELILSETKFNKYVTEKDISDFFDKASVHSTYKTRLRLTYIKNFAKTIPEEITKLKLEADELKVFDNYAILHYDYDGKAVEDTKEEKQRKKDPILFGLIKGSDRLYYIGDWISDYCDLTLDVLIKTIGSEEKVLDPVNDIKSF